MERSMVGWKNAWMDWMGTVGIFVSSNGHMGPATLVILASL